MKKILFCLIWLACCPAYILQAEEKEEKTPEITPVKEEFVETHHTLSIKGQTLSYKAIAGTLPVRDKEGKVKGNIFFVSYTKEGVQDTSQRPVTFCFNGGPGSSSVWLHMGMMGPKRVDLDKENPFTPPYKVIDNESSFLDLTDLVFIDPISTGFSRGVTQEDAKKFHGVDEDIESIAGFIRLYTTKYNRWDSPKFIAGESYGTTRAAGLALKLHDWDFYYLNGVILISSILNFETIYNENGGNDLPYLLYLPSYTATAWYHEKLPGGKQKSLLDTLKSSESFALNEYPQILMKGQSLTPDERKTAVSRLAALTGLSEEYIDRSNLRVPMGRFAQELLRNQKKVVGRFDSRFTGFERDPVNDSFSYDPSVEAVLGAYTAAFNHYLRNDLKWEKDDTYKILVDVQPWNYSKATNQYLNMGDSLSDVMTKNPRLRIFVGSGFFDLAAPYFSTVYTFNHLADSPEFQSRIDRQFYESGHMIYIDPPSLGKLKQDLSAFYQSAVKK